MFFLISTLPFLAVNEITAVFKASDPFLQVLCVLLFLASLAVWTVLFDRLFFLGHAYAKNRRFLNEFAALKHFPAELKAQAEASNAPVAAVYLAACARLEPGRATQPAENHHIRSIDIVHIGSAMRRTIERQRFILKKHTLFLKTAITGIPLLGITGLLWGILIAFEKYAQTGCNDVRPLAAGAPAALLPLVIALLALVPTLIGSRLVSARIENIMSQFDILAEEIRVAMESGQDICPDAGSVSHDPSTDKELFVRSLLLSFLTNPRNRNGKD